MKNLIILGFASIIITNFAEAACVPARQVIKYPEDLPGVGQYHRIHPSGKYIMASGMTGDYSAGVGIVDLTSKNDKGETVAKFIRTPLIDETYPVEGNWKLLASPNNSDGMRYYDFQDVLKNNVASKPIMNDEQHNQYYHSASELPDSTAKVVKFRTMLWSEKYRDYTVTYDNAGKVISTTHTDTKRACSNLTNFLNAPILSKDGSEVAAIDNSGNAVIYKIKEDSTCEIVENLGFPTSKVNFSYPKPGTKGQIVFRGNANVMVDGVPTPLRGVFIYDRDTKTTRRLSSNTDNNASYPGMTKDGRVIYTNINSREIVIVDPNQLNADGTERTDKSNCIQEEGTVKSGGKSAKKTTGVNQN